MIFSRLSSIDHAAYLKQIALLKDEDTPVAKRSRIDPPMDRSPATSMGENLMGAIHPFLAAAFMGSTGSHGINPAAAAAARLLPPGILGAGFQGIPFMNSHASGNFFQQAELVQQWQAMFMQQAAGQGRFCPPSVQFGPLRPSGAIPGKADAMLDPDQVSPPVGNTETSVSVSSSAAPSAASSISPSTTPKNSSSPPKNPPTSPKKPTGGGFDVSDILSKK